jgi:hypothetical protein
VKALKKKGDIVAVMGDQMTLGPVMKSAVVGVQMYRLRRKWYHAKGLRCRSKLGCLFWLADVQVKEEMIPRKRITMQV